jgi:uncharacterized protein
MGISKGAALITGASSGIGATYADRLAGRGFDLILVARRQDSLAELLRKARGRNVEVFPADLGNPGDLARVEAFVRSREDIEILVNEQCGPGGTWSQRVRRHQGGPWSKSTCWR